MSLKDTMVAHEEWEGIQENIWRAHALSACLAELFSGLQHRTPVDEDLVFYHVQPRHLTKVADIFRNARIRGFGLGAHRTRSNTGETRAPMACRALLCRPSRTPV